MSGYRAAISVSLREQVLAKLGFSAPPEVSDQGLAQVYRAWCQRVPFDNVLKRIQSQHDRQTPLPGFTPTDFFNQWLRFGVGGTCWASQGAICALLASLGFNVKYGLSTMLSPRPQPGPSPGHGTLVVDTGDGPLIVDATMLHGSPLSLRAGQAAHPVWGTRTHFSDGYWCINWKPLGRPWVDCRLLDLDAPAAEFPRRHELSRDNSRFNSATLIRRAGEETIIGMVKGEKIVRQADGQEIRQALSWQQQQQLLIEEFFIAEEIALKMPRDDTEIA
ncbi:MAG: arylamine N-acetyltransferase [Mixta sp.]